MIPATFRRVGPLRRLAAMLVVGMVTPAAALAQSGPAQVSPRLALGAGGGIAQPLHGDFDFVAPFWEVSARGRLGTRAAVEVVIGQWRHREGFEQEVVLPGVPRPDGRLSQQTVRKGRSMEINLAALGRIGQWSVTAGGGVGALTWRREVERSVTGCGDPNSPVCGSSRSTTSTSSAVVIGLAGAEVAATDRISIYGQFKFIGSTRDFGSSELRYSAGVRFAIWR